MSEIPYDVERERCLMFNVQPKYVGFLPDEACSKSKLKKKEEKKNRRKNNNTKTVDGVLANATSKLSFLNSEDLVRMRFRR